MGVPKFFRWISERYPKINQPIHCPPDQDTHARYFPETTDCSNNKNNDDDTKFEPSKTSNQTESADKTHGLKSSVLPEFDRLYLDMNGIIHCCSHNNASQNNASPGIEPDVLPVVDDSSPPSNNPPSGAELLEDGIKIPEKDIFRNVCYYIDRVVTDIAQPKELVYMAIDGVAPRAKMNQQRSRRYRSGKEKEIESTFYGAHLHQQKIEKEARELKRESLQEEVYGVDALQLGLNPYENHTFREVKDDGDVGNGNDTDVDSTAVKEVEDGRFVGTFETSATSNSNSPSSTEFDQDFDTFLRMMQQDDSIDAPSSSTFHSNSITPGTNFFERCTAHLEYFVKRKLHSDPRWAHLTIIFSGPNVPGEGEHKIMDFIRKQKQRKEYDPNIRHCLFGQDGDLIMLGLATHEPHFALLREEVIFDQKRKDAALARAASAIAEKQARGANNDGGSSVQVSASLDSYMHNANFELLHMSVLRDYLAYEFETKDVLSNSPFDIERTIDDFVFMTFFVGNDFLPHMPAIDIADEAFDLLFYIYKRNRWRWVKEKAGGADSTTENSIPGTQEYYLTKAGEIVSGQRLERFLLELGHHEDPYYDNKKRTEDNSNKRMRKADENAGRESSVPPDEILAAKEEWDRANYREMLKSIGSQPTTATMDGFKPVASSGNLFSKPDDSAMQKKERKSSAIFKPETVMENEDDLLSRMGTLLRSSLSQTEHDSATISGSNKNLPSSRDGSSPDLDEHVTDLKGRYYYDKFKFSPMDAEKHVSLRKAYIEGLVWNLQYYYKGCVSWDWFYPYHYGPMLSDLVDIDNMLKEISFDEETSEPWKAYEQLMSVLPPSSAYLLPKPYQWLMKSSKSPIKDFYPESFSVDMNGKRWPWEAVVLLPFIDAKRLIETSRDLVTNDVLTAEEIDNNLLKEAKVYTHDKSCNENLEAASDGYNFDAIDRCHVREIEFNQTHWNDIPDQENATFRPELLPGAVIPQPGFPTLKVAPIQGLIRRRVGINIFGRRSRYRTAVLDLDNEVPVVPPVDILAKKLIGRAIHFRYPYLQEGFVTSMSDAEITIRGTNAPRRWSKPEAKAWVTRRDIIRRKYETGEGITGSGGWKIPEARTTLSVRPLKEIQDMPDGSKVKVYAQLEVEVPLLAALYTPSQPDPRLANTPARLEKNPYRFGNEPHLSSFLDSNKSGLENSKQNVAIPSVRATQSASFKEGTTRILPDIKVNLASKSALKIDKLDPDNRIKLKSKGFGILPPRQIVGKNRLPKSPVSSGLAGSTRGYSTISGSLQRLKYSNNELVFGSHKKLHQLPISRAVQRSTRTKGIATVFVAAAAFFSRDGVSAERNMFNFHSTKSQMHPPKILSRSMSSVLSFHGGELESQILPLGLEDQIQPAPTSHSTPPLEFSHGTTTLSFIFDGGIITAVDSRASIGNFVGSKTTQKVLPINKHIVGTMAGGAADCSFWIRRLQAEVRLYELTENRGMTVARASRILADYLYSNKGLNLSVGTMITGFDDDCGPSIYYVDNTGMRIQGELFSVGSGSTFALGVLDTERRKDMNEDEAIALGIKAIRHATYRDSYSGGYIAVYVITNEGWRKVFSEDLALTAEEHL